MSVDTIKDFQVTQLLRDILDDIQYHTSYDSELYKSVEDKVKTFTANYEEMSKIEKEFSLAMSKDDFVTARQILKKAEEKYMNTPDFTRMSTLLYFLEDEQNSK